MNTIQHDDKIDIRIFSVAEAKFIVYVEIFGNQRHYK